MKNSMFNSFARLYRNGFGFLGLLFVVMVPTPGLYAQTNAGSADTATNLPAWITRPLSLADALNTALQQNGVILKAKNDLEATYGVVVQTRAVAIPKVQATANYTDLARTRIDDFPAGGSTSKPLTLPNENWNADIRVVQNIYQGGQIASALRAAKLTKEQSILQYQATVADTLLAVRVAYYDVLDAEQQIIVNEASVNLLEKELEDQQNRFNAGTVPRFNVLRAEVAVANARPPLISARNTYRISKNNLSTATERPA